MMIEAQRIACENRAGADLSFAAKGMGVETPQTGTVNVLQTALIDLAYYPLKEGIALSTDMPVRGDARATRPPQPESTRFIMNGRTAYYAVTGSLFDWQIAFRTLGSPRGRPAVPGFPADVPPNLLPYDNWDRTICSPGYSDLCATHRL